MTTKNAPSVVRMDRDDLANLLTPVNETLATDVAYLQPAKPKQFGTVQLWNIRRKARYIGTVVR